MDSTWLVASANKQDFIYRQPGEMEAHASRLPETRQYAIRVGEDTPVAGWPRRFRFKKSCGVSEAVRRLMSIRSLSRRKHGGRELRRLHNGAQLTSGTWWNLKFWSSIPAIRYFCFLKPFHFYFQKHLIHRVKSLFWTCSYKLLKPILLYRYFLLTRKLQNRPFCKTKKTVVWKPSGKMIPRPYKKRWTLNYFLLV